MIKYIFLSILPFVFGYELLQHYIPTSFTKEFYVDNSLRDYSSEVCNYINEFNIHRCVIISPSTGSTNPILQNNINTISVSYTNDNYYGYTKLYGNNETDIIINHKLLKTKNTLYNVLLHEVIHSLGLNHTLVPSVMNFTIFLDSDNNIIEDRRRIYLSIDDVKGLRYIKQTLKCGK
jgi:hypothetical protein